MPQGSPEITKLWKKTLNTWHFWRDAFGKTLFKTLYFYHFYKKRRQ